VFIGLGKYDFKLCDLEILITHPNAQVWEEPVICN
jgi:hypothetical protein